MLRKLLLLICLFGVINVFAQKNGDAPVKATEKQGEPKIDYKQPGAPLPPLQILAYYDTAAQGAKKEEKKKYLTNSDFDNGANLLVMMFNPTCSHCQDETEMLEKNIFYFKKSKLIMIANMVMVPYMPDFVKNFHIAEYPSFIIGFDATNFISELFLYAALPQLNIYDGDRKLIKTFSGEVSIDSLKGYIQ
jgi:hypothetical protein